MDTSTSPVQNTPNAQPSVGRAQPPAAAVSAGSLTQLATDPGSFAAPASQNISGGSPEQGPIQSSAPVENSQDDRDEEDAPARQEVSTRPVGQVVEQQIEVSPSVPEIAIEKSIEHVVEKAPDIEKPKLSEAVKAVGVTHSGPGVPVDENVFLVKTLPMTFEQALVEEKAHPKMNDSKHWLAELVLYVWRKIDPKKGKEKGEKQENKMLKVFN
jgi:hypothetical protein